MSSKTKTTAMKEEATPALVPKLRFPEFREAKAWESGKIDDLVDTVTPPKKLPTAVYATSGAFPIIDQSQSNICGWTDDTEALIREGFPLIVFGDHTCILKLIARPFAQGADGIKILKTRTKIGTSYLYQFLNYQPVATEEYKRHYSILKEKAVFFPEIKSGEQQKIAECLSSVDELMAAQARKVEVLKTHKKGLDAAAFSPRRRNPTPPPLPRISKCGGVGGSVIG
jgi:type I restriction enzyme S subunit